MLKSVAAQVGIDVSKKELAVSVDSGRARPFANTPEGILALMEGLPPGSQVHLESSGGFERLVSSELKRAGHEVWAHNPLKVKRLRQALGQGAKTDPMDAKELCERGHLLPQRAARSEKRQGLTDLSRSIQALREHAAQLRKAAKTPCLEKAARLGLESAARSLSQEARLLEREFEARVGASELRASYELLLSVPSVGPCTARVVLCELPEDFMERTGAQLCSYAALAPMDDSSGGRVGAARVGQGNRRLKGGLYMAAVCCVRTQGWARGLYARLRSKGRAHQQAICAVMRRLLLRILAVLKGGSPWRDEPLRA